MNSKFYKNRLRIVLIMLFMLVVFLGFSYAYFRVNIEDVEIENTISTTAGKMIIRYSESKNIIANNIIPGWSDTKYFSVTGNNTVLNTGSESNKMNYKVLLIIEENEFSTGAITYNLELDSANSTINGSSLSNTSGSLQTGEEVIELGSGYFNYGEGVHSYVLTFSLPSLWNVDQSVNAGKAFSGYIDFYEDNSSLVFIKTDDGYSNQDYSNVRSGDTLVLEDLLSDDNNKLFIGWKIINNTDAALVNGVLTVGENNVYVKPNWMNKVTNFDYIEPTDVNLSPYYSYEVPKDGVYKLETWGAQGGSYNDVYRGGYGGYSSGNVYLDKNEKVYVYVGGEGASSAVESVTGGYNGGGTGQGGNCSGSSVRTGCSGGGASHMSLLEGALPNLSDNSKESLLIISGGGGGAYFAGASYGSGANAGGYIGNNGEWINVTHDYVIIPVGGSQALGGSAGNSYSNEEPTWISNSRGNFGQGGSIKSWECENGSGGGGGYYGGGGSLFTPGAGGSGYIGNNNLTDKAMYCYNCETSNEVSTKTITTSCVSETPTENCAKKGNGYARITYISDLSN